MFPRNNSSCSYRTLTATQMINHPLRISSNGFIDEYVDDKISEENTSLQSLSHSNLEYSFVTDPKIKKMGSLESELSIHVESNEIKNNNENISQINNIFKHRLNITNDGFERETLEILDVSSMKGESESNASFESDKKSPSSFVCRDESQTISSPVIHIRSDSYLYLVDLIKNVNKVAKGKNVLSLVNDELILGGQTFQSSKENERRDKICLSHNSKTSVKISEETNFDKCEIDFERNENEDSRKSLFKNQLFIPNTILNPFMENSEIQFKDMPIENAWPTMTAKSFGRVLKCNKDNFTGKSSLTVSDPKETFVMKKHNRKEIKNLCFEKKMEKSLKLREDLCRQSLELPNNEIKTTDEIFFNTNEISKKNNVSHNFEHSFHWLMGCCSECSLYQNVNKRIIYNVPPLTEVVEESERKSFPEFESEIVILSEKLPCKKGKNMLLETSSQSRKSSSKASNRKALFSDHLTYRLHKKVFKKFNPRSLLLFHIPTSSRWIRRMGRADERVKSSNSSVKNGSKEHLEKKDAEDSTKELCDDESLLISHINKSSDTL
ncbi:uncharacterized protein NPIL_102961 [Nephila pilipes]|uniref:Uncharacterized protein n=1 Tax=Nephila pilipes TaxID=299642 RepID=A0A8X6UMV7_NEPPI|nr:uncharacterized protein NPIL_102961 [Nephila pilipes]